MTFIKGALSIFLYGLNLFICCILLLTGLFKKPLPGVWIKTNRIIRKLLTRTQIDVNLPPGLSNDKFYIVTANHQSWVDILVLFDIFHGRIPMLKFFLKKQLIWLPMVGFACWLYGFPFLHRHTQAQLKKHPEWKGKDFEATKKACERFKQEPGSLMIFAEGTRFTKKKHDRQQSPYHYLLKPKAGGLAFALQCMGDHIENLIDVTIVYPKNKLNFWDYCKGRISKITVNVRLIPLSPEVKGDYESDHEFRRRFQQFLNQIWMEKDEWIKTHPIP